MHSAAQLSSAQFSSNINLFKIFALLFNALNSGLPRFLIKARNDRKKKTVIPSVAKESRIKKVNFKNLVLLINEFYKKWIALAFSMPRNDKHISKFEIISHNKNLKSIYYGFLFNKQNFIVRGGIGQ